jgi:capsular polysaccharide biosynthesis protein
LWADDTPVAEEAEDRSSADLVAGLVSLGFFGSVLRRKARVWCLTGLLGLVIGAGLYVKYPPAHHATTSVLLVYNTNENPEVQVQNEASLASSLLVAGRVVNQLNLPQSVASFQAAYSVTVITPNVLTINVGAPSSAAAVQRAAAVASAYLAYRAQYAQAQYQLLVTQLNQQSDAAQQRLTTLQAKSDEVAAEPSTPAQRSEYESLQTQIGQQNQIVQYAATTEATKKTDTNTVVTGSYVLNAATAVKPSKVKGPALYFAGGLFGGLVVGMAGVIIGALMSRRLRRRSDVAAALGAPVKLSVGPLRKRRGRQGARQERDMKRIVAFLRGAVPGSSRGPASLAVVAVDDADVTARAVASLAGACAAEGKQVVVADLSAGGHLARLLGVSDPGIRPVSENGADFVMVLPEPEDVAPAGPVPGSYPAVTTQASEAVVNACASADLLLTLATLDPSFGGEYLGTWTTDAVAVVTAGESTAEKIRSVGDMVRLAGTRLDSAVLIGADKKDESVGMMNPAG